MHPFRCTGRIIDAQPGRGKAARASPGLNYAGWKFWLDKLNDNGGNFAQAEMVEAFLAPDEYRKRFGQ